VSVRRRKGIPEICARAGGYVHAGRSQKLVEKFFSENFRDVTRAKRSNGVARGQAGRQRLHPLYVRATIWGKDKLMMNQVFTFNAKGEYVSYENMAGYPKDVKE